MQNPRKCVVSFRITRGNVHDAKDSDRRIDSLHDLAQELRKNKEEFARTARNEIGKAIKEARSEVEKCGNS